MIEKGIEFERDTMRNTVEDGVFFLEEYENRDFLDLIQYIRWDDKNYDVRNCYYVRNPVTDDKVGYLPLDHSQLALSFLENNGR